MQIGSGDDAHLDDAEHLRHGMVQEHQLRVHALEQAADDRSRLAHGRDAQLDLRSLLQYEAVPLARRNGHTGERRDRVGLGALELMQQVGGFPVASGEGAHDAGHGDRPRPARDGSRAKHAQLHPPFGADDLIAPDAHAEVRSGRVVR